MRGFRNAFPLPHRHAFRAAGITDYRETGGMIENAQAIAAHESPRKTKLCDRPDDPAINRRFVRARQNRCNGSWILPSQATPQ